MITKNIIMIVAIAIFIVNRIFQIQSFFGFAAESPNPTLRIESRKKININLLISTIIVMITTLTILDINVLLEIIIAIAASLVIEVLTLLITIVMDYLK